MGSETGPSPVDRGRPGSKHHLLVDQTGIPLAFALTGSNRNDVTQLMLLLDAVPAVGGLVGRPRRRPDCLIADRGYDHDKYRRFVGERGIKPMIARRQTEHGSSLGRYRWVVERTFARLHQFKRLLVATADSGTQSERVLRQGGTPVAGLRAGLAASVLSFLALNFFFTEPFHTLTVGKLEDLVALVVFLVVSGIVGTLLSTAVAQRAHAARREREALLLHRLGTRLLSGEPIGEVLESFARAVTDLLPLARCEIRTEMTTEPVVSERPGAAMAAGDPEVISMLAMSQEVGQILLFPEAPLRHLADEERSVVQTFASQMGLALEGTRLGAEAARARLDAETSRLRAALFSSVTHDLRTPLASITAAVTSLLPGDASFTPEDRLELLETIRQEADRLNRLVGNLLDLSRIRAGALVPTKAPAAIEEVIEGVVARLEPILAGHDVRLMLRDNMPPVPMDIVQIDQVVTNLLENGAKFSRSGGPITVSAARWEDVVEVRVADRGPGIPAEEREKVFEPFVRGDRHPAAGSGLGLSIGRAIVESHGGRIWIEGTPGGGATVVFQLPVSG